MVEIERDTNLKTFNTAKVFAESILFPLMFDFKKFQRMSNYGTYDLKDAREMPEEIRDIERYNGLKAMVETTHDLLKAIASTVRLKGNKKEIEQLNKLLETTDQLKHLFYEHKEAFFKVTYFNMRTVDVLDRGFFEKIRDIIDSCYINTEILMTRNKLLFADSSDEYMTDEELKEAIKKEYIEN